ncbi:hypothetical protein LC2W_1205 [Lacticaseibacillus paracasei]|uniref:Uncharacterized protein n=2 Tax=Lacticaseibacillus paracasei subsp. paracasei TaxID=47714 RepID=A0AAP9HGK8_LACPA|nr:hypothetical protein LC2W_1205 [Lacticaseibacillus paracasei]EEI66953.1 hypothetical protein HMPREF0530_2762 [Lacticaseibacillus paracasei subsp. paracasei ATCC 25302 = DSM 5622 = JCM 8130]EPC19674.1 hypothetical protein Lpp226_1691 [Lacticaseibacillus paracasei subsp. paracasei Lpp226]EPC22558.1 hypothetical protein Lpp22_2446 [Lacticaseibacillus paracasei subsp. paracasei Lpp22]EPC30550.1 hypothetical protein Lpp120_2155 [Lacticaseibacillus paracasei subsp. paracasei Lpp120]EPC31921.1 hyp
MRSQAQKPVHKHLKPNWSKTHSFKLQVTDVQVSKRVRARFV